MDFLKKWWREAIVLGLILSNIFVWITVHERQPSDVLTVYFLDIGQGDAILIDSPEHNRVLIDGGKNRKVLTELGRTLPFGDKHIDVVIATHPDADHIGGLPEVVDRYKVGVFLESDVKTENNINDVLHARLDDKDIQKITARRGMVLDLGGGAKLSILFPNQDVSTLDPNDASIVAKLVYGEDSFLFTGDAELRTENILLNLDEDSLNSDVLKVGHHGSRSSTFILFAEAVSPEYAVISAGKNNSYGHPHKEVLDILKKVDAKVLSTINLGTIKFETDGKTLEIK
jgi:competence protein ComEC